jgi:hypothetical protein
VYFLTDLFQDFAILSLFLQLFPHNARSRRGPKESNMQVAQFLSAWWL